MRFERGASERLVVVMPVVDVVDRPPRDLTHFVGLRPELTADRLAEIHHRHDTVRVTVRSRLPGEHADELADARDEADLLGDLAHRGLGRGLVRVDPARHEAPAIVVDASDEQDPVVLVEEGRVGTDLGGDVSQISGEARANLGDVEAGTVGVLACGDREQLLVPVAVERVRRVVQAGLRDRAAPGRGVR